MNMSISSRIICHLLVLSLAITLSLSRPQSSIDSQDSSEIMPSIPELRKFYANLSPLVNSNSDETPLDRLQLQLLAQYAQNSVGGGAGSWDQLYRMPEVKRQARYRQCYFNPISCFK